VSDVGVAAVVNIDITPVNDAPTVSNTMADQAATEDTAFSFQFAANTFNDVDGDILSYTSDASGWLSFDAATRTFSGTPLNADVGTTTVTVITDDGNGGSVSDSFAIVVANTNDAPYFTGNVSGIAVPENTVVHPFETGVSIVDVDNLDFDGGVLTVRSGTPGLVTDQLSLLQQDGLTLSVNNVLNNGVTIGTWSGGANGSDLTVAFNSNAHQSDVQLVFTHIEYVSTDQEPTSSPVISVTISDGDGGVSGNLNGTVVLISVNDAPEGSDSTIALDEDTVNVKVVVA